MRRYLAIICRKAIAAAVAFALLVPGRTFAENREDPVDLSGVKTCALAEMNSLNIIVQKEGGEKQNVAGLAMLPALLYVCESFDTAALEDDTIVTVSEEAAAVKGPTAFLRPYEQIGAGLLLKAAVMITAGDAITALAETAAGTEQNAVTAINLMLEERGITGRCDSLFAPDMLLSANELLLLGKALLCSKSFLRFSAVYLDEIVHGNGEKTELVSRNRLLVSVSGCNGIATGSSDEAGYCGVFSVNRGDTQYLCAVTGAENAAARFETARILIEDAFASYKITKAVSAGERAAENIPVLGGTKTKVDLVAREDAVLIDRQGETYTRQLYVPNELRAPVVSQEQAGKLVIVNGGGETVSEVLLYPAEDIPAAGFLDRMEIIMKRWVSG